MAETFSTAEPRVGDGNDRSPRPGSGPNWRFQAILLVLVVLLGSAATAVWHIGHRESQDVQNSAKNAAEAEAGAKTARAQAEEAAAKTIEAADRAKAAEASATTAKEQATAAARSEAAAKQFLKESKEVLKEVRRVADAARGDAFSALGFGTGLYQDDLKKREQTAPTPATGLGWILAAFCDNEGRITGRNVEGKNDNQLETISDFKNKPTVRLLVTMNVRKEPPSEKQAEKSEFGPAIGRIDKGKEVEVKGYEQVPFRGIQEIWVSIDLSKPSPKKKLTPTSTSVQ
jgi:hypothetical protein